MVVIYGIKENLNPIKADLSDVIQQSMTQALGLPEDKRAHRFILLDKVISTILVVVPMLTR
ncbi:hypothetical protein XM79_c11565 [Vibrio vulnificus]|nr:hypothetical protein XM78_c11584 [Vibrio vulnificus]OQK66546.1 hypothetical protein XM79_c11565 [Vibrio vulnificus]